MAKPKSIYVCNECGFEASKWQGQCPQCNNWNTFIEQIKTSDNPKAKPSLSDNAPPRRLKEVSATAVDRIPTGISEFDRVLGGGIVRDSVSIITAQPGAGKSTLILMASNNIGEAGITVLYISGEESEGQVKSRGDRLTDDNISENVWIKSENCMERIKQYIKDINPQLIIIDSIQTIYSETALPSRAGGAVQIVSCTDELVSIAKREQRAVFMVGHLTKSEELAGVKTLEHMVDTVLYLEGDRTQSLRVLQSIKNRYYETEMGYFTMEQQGLIPIDNPCDFFLTKREEDVMGCALTVSLEGTRPIVIEIESLVDKSAFGTPMRIAEGVNKQQLQVLVATLEKRAGLQLGYKDVYVKVSGGIKITEPAVNMGVLMAIASSQIDKPIDSKTVFIGEVGLTGETKPVSQINRRLKEVSKMGFKKAYIPKGNYKGEKVIDQLEVIEVANIRQIINNVFH